MTTVKSKNQEIPSSCRHCGEPGKGFEDDEFCCRGCKLAWQLIHDLELSRYYSLNRTVPTARDQKDNLIQLYDDAEFRATFSRSGDTGETSRLKIDGMDCYACSWLIKEAISRTYSDIEVSISLSRGLCEVTMPVETSVKLSEIVGFIRSLGYGVTPSFGGAVQESGKELIRIGVNLFCFINIMLLALPEYVDPAMIEDVRFWSMFRYLSAVLCTIVMTFGAWPFFQNSIGFLRQRRISIDLLIVFALSLTWAFSVFNTLRSEGPVYFDSVAIVVTLLTLSRFLQKRMIRKAEERVLGHYDHSMQYVRELVEGSSETRIVPVSDIDHGDFYEVLVGDPIPVDSRVIKGWGEVHYEQISGETDPVQVQSGSVIKSGAMNLTSRLELQSLESGSESFVFKMSEVLERMLSERGLYSSVSDRLAAGFFGIVLVISGFIFFYGLQLGWEEAVARTVAALLIACPCAFAVAVPLTMTMCTASSIRKGVVFKSQKAIETLGTISRYFFDKSGTLTAGVPGVVECREFEWTKDARERDVLFEICTKIDTLSSHQVLAAIAGWAQKQPVVLGSHTDTVEALSEQVGMGVQFQVEGLTVRVGNSRFCDVQSEQNSKFSTYIAIRRKEDVGWIPALAFHLDDQLLPGTEETIRWLQQNSIEAGVISGDRQSKVHEVATRLGIKPELVFGEVTPDRKLAIVRDQSKRYGSLAMVGNGYNDSFALAGSSLGIVVNNASQPAKDAAELCLITPGVSAIVESIRSARKAKKKIFSCFMSSILFNLIGISMAATGYLPPVAAAILMPISSTIVIGIATKGWRSNSGD